MEFKASIYELHSCSYVTELNNERFELGDNEQRLIFFDKNEADNVVMMLNDIYDGTFVLLEETTGEKHSKMNLKTAATEQDCCRNPDCEGFDSCEECKKDFAEHFAKTNAQVLAELLGDFIFQEDFMQEQIAEYIACPQKPYECEHYGDNYSGCVACKIRWLKERWEA